MLKELFQYVVSLSSPDIMELDGYTYSDKKLNVLPRENSVELSLYMSTLSGLIDYIKNAGRDFIFDSYIIHVVSPVQVYLISPLDTHGRRDTLAVAKAEIPEFEFGRYYQTEDFLIAVRSQFEQTEDRDLIVKFAGTSEKKTLQSYKDDGISQKVTVSSGIAGKEDALVPTIVKLKPFSTFTEIAQPEREFVFRMRDGNDGLKCALFEADGGAWKRLAMKSIEEYLKQEIGTIDREGVPSITVIA